MWVYETDRENVSNYWEVLVVSTAHAACIGLISRRELVSWSLIFVAIFAARIAMSVGQLTPLVHSEISQPLLDELS